MEPYDKVIKLIDRSKFGSKTFSEFYRVLQNEGIIIFVEQQSHYPVRKSSADAKIKYYYKDHYIQEDELGPDYCYHSLIDYFNLATGAYKKKHYKPKLRVKN